MKQYKWVGPDSYKGLHFFVVDINKKKILVKIDDEEKAGIVQCSDKCDYFNKNCKWKDLISKDSHLFCIPLYYFKAWIKRKLLIRI